MSVIQEMNADFSHVGFYLSSELFVGMRLSGINGALFTSRLAMVFNPTWLLSENVRVQLSAYQLTITPRLWANSGTEERLFFVDLRNKFKKEPFDRAFVLNALSESIVANRFGHTPVFLSASEGAHPYREMKRLCLEDAYALKTVDGSALICTVNDDGHLTIKYNETCLDDPRICQDDLVGMAESDLVAWFDKHVPKNMSIYDARKGDIDISSLITVI